MNLLCQDKQFGSKEKDFIKLIDYFRENNRIDKDFLSAYEPLNDAYTLHLVAKEVGEKYCFCIYSLLQDLRTIDEKIKKLHRGAENYERARKLQNDINSLQKAKKVFFEYSSNSDFFIKELDKAIKELESIELKPKNIKFEFQGNNISLQHTSFLTEGHKIFDKRLDSLKPHPNIFFNVINEGLQTFKRSMKAGNIKYDVHSLDALHNQLKELYTLK